MINYIRNRSRGFTVIEILLGLVIVGILGFTGWYVINAKSKADDTLSKAEISKVEQADKAKSNQGEPKPDSEASTSTSQKSNPAPQTLNLNKVDLHNPYTIRPEGHGINSVTCHISATLYTNGTGKVTYKFSQNTNDPKYQYHNDKGQEKTVTISAAQTEIEANFSSYEGSASYSYGLEVLSPIQATYKTDDKSWCSNS